MTYKKWIVVAIALFVLGLVLGLFPPPLLASLISREVEELGKFGQSLVPFSVFTFTFIFARNAIALVVSFVFSPVLCLLPILSLVNNGALLSFVVTTVAHDKSALFVLAGLLPHGIFEIPALIIGQAAALSLGAILMQAAFKKAKRKQILPTLKQSLKYLLIALALLLPAAAIEAFVTPLLLQ